MRYIIIPISLIFLLILGYWNAVRHEDVMLDEKQYIADLEAGRGIFKYCDAGQANTGWDLGRVIELNERCLKIVEELKTRRVDSTTQSK